MFYNLKKWIEQKNFRCSRKKINRARRFLEKQGVWLTRDWMDIEYKGKLYYTLMIEEYKEKIVITAKPK